MPKTTDFENMEYIDRLWQVLLGQYPPRLPKEIPLITSLCYCSTAILFGRLLRWISSRIFPTQWLPYINDAIFTFQALLCSLEHGQIRKHYGIGAYALSLFVISMWHDLTVKDSSANPCTHVLSYTQGKSSLRHTLLHIFMQTCGGLLSYRCAKLFWSLEFTQSHGRRYLASKCLADLSVHPLVGLLIESGGTILETSLAMMVFTRFGIMEAATKTSIGCLLTVLGVDYTGYYLNPINATNQTFGCHGISLFLHFIIYWAGPLLSTALVAHFLPILMQKWNSCSQKSNRRLLMFSPSMTFEEIDADNDDQGGDTCDDKEDINQNLNSRHETYHFKRRRSTRSRGKSSQST